MTLRERAVAAYQRVRAAAADARYPQALGCRLRAVLIRDVAAMLGIAPEYVVVTDDPMRSYGAAIPAQLITVYDPDDPGAVWRFVPEPGNTGIGGGAYLLLTACPGCSTPDAERDVPMLSVAVLADLARSPIASRRDGEELDLERVPVEFFDDPGHAPECPIR